MLSDSELLDLLADIESDRVERKASLSDRDRVRQAICAFANDLPDHRQPGVVFLGVHDDGTCANLRITDELLRTLSDMRSDGNILPFPVMTVRKRVLDGCELAVVEVRPSYHPPVRYNGRAWIRVGPRRATATSDEERLLSEKRRAGDLPFDQRAVQNATLDDLDLDLFQQVYVPSAVAPDVLAANERPAPQQLASLRFVSREGEPNTAAVLVFGKDPLQWFPGAYVQFARFDGAEVTDAIRHQKEIHGPMPALLRQLDEVLDANVSVAGDVRAERTEIRQADYPIVALQQLTRNAVLHRSYESTHAPARVYWFFDRIEVHSPGGLYGQVNAENFGRPGVTDYRNPLLAEAMKVLGYVQRFGMGIPLARRELEKNGNPPLELTASPNAVVVTFAEEAVKTIAFFNNKGGVGKTSLTYHLASMYADLGLRVVAADLDPQANLSSMFLDEDRLEELWPDGEHPQSILGTIRPILKGTGDIAVPHIEDVSDNIGLLVGDLGLSTFEDKLSDAWPRCHDRDESAFRIISAFHRILLRAAKSRDAELVLLDVGPNLGAINRAAIIAAEHVAIPLASDLFSLQGLRNLGPALREWRKGWNDRRRSNPDPELDLPGGQMMPAGYVVMRHAVRLDRPVQAYSRWMDRIPAEYQSSVLDDGSKVPSGVAADPNCLAQLKRYRSLMPMAMEARKPMFFLKPADGAIGAHANAVRDCYQDFKRLAEKLAKRCKVALP